MELFRKIAELKARIDADKSTGAVIGFVPTMGALHDGHLSLVEKAGETSDIVVVSIFVNPAQFNDPNDLQKYPRDLDQDMKLLEQTACNYIFAPDVKEVYPEQDTRVFDFGEIGDVMEGKHRKGHFNGVAQVVSRLFDIIGPHKAFFGQKDFQQLAIIRLMVKQLKMNVEIVPCPIVRENDGLAMSSRNRLLSPKHRQSATRISQTLFQARNLTLSMSVEEIKEWVVATVNEDPYLRVEYFEVVDTETLRPVECWEEKPEKTGCIAVYAGNVRLIDNITF